MTLEQLEQYAKGKLKLRGRWVCTILTRSSGLAAGNEEKQNDERTPAELMATMDSYIELPEYPDEVKQLFQVTSDFIKWLPLSAAQNDKLVQLMVDNVTTARKDGSMNGFLAGAVS